MPETERRKYVRHEESQRAAVLNAAEGLVRERSLDSVSMGDIAARAGMTRATLYRYYGSKEEVCWAVYNRMMRDVTRDLVPHISNDEATTYERICSFLDYMAGYLDRDPDIVRFIGAFYKIYEAATTEPGKKTYRKMHGEGFGTGDAVRVLTEGFHDGSVREDLDPTLTVTTIVYTSFILTGELTRMTKGLDKKYGLTPRSVLEQHFDMIREYLRPR